MKLLNILLLTTILSACFIAGGLWYTIHNYEVDFAPLAHYNPGHPSIVLDDEGKEWARFQLDRRDLIPLSQMPQHLIHAFIAAEDWAFFSHSGISFKGIIRSTLVNIAHGKIVQGASTITQQLVKLLFFSSARTFKRKVKEQLFAFLVEQQFSKEQILETYLNHVYFGCGIYGVEAASQRFWGKPAAQLTVAESATLAAIVRSPGQYCPILAPLSSKQRRNVILSSMKKLHFITEQEYKKYSQESLAVAPVESQIGAYYKEAVRQQLEELFGKELLYAGGLTIQTTLNRKAQVAAEKSLQEQIFSLRTTVQPTIDGGLLVLEVSTGEIKALVGGYNFAESKFNRALQARRQIGSTLKPLVYAQAMKAGLSFADVEVDEPLDIVQDGALWQPHNYNEQFDGPMTLAHALTHSNNIVAIKVLMKVGPARVAELAQRCHLTDPIYPYPSLALGCVDANVKEVAGMFNIFASGGMYHEPHMIKWVKDQWGSKLWKAEPVHERILSANVTGKVSKVLEHGIKRLRTTFHAPLIDSDVISKTGTTNDSRSCWYAGSTPIYTTVIYVGCDDNRPMGADIYPSKTAFPIWQGVMSQLLHEPKKFTYDSSLHMIFIDRWTGKRVPEGENALEIAV